MLLVTQLLSTGTRIWLPFFSHLLVCQLIWEGMKDQRVKGCEGQRRAVEFSSTLLEEQIGFLNQVALHPLKGHNVENRAVQFLVKSTPASESAVIIFPPLNKLYSSDFLDII